MFRMTGSICLMLVALMGTAASASDASFPFRRITIVVPFAPGASSDAMARVVASSLSEATGQPVIVENKPGGKSVIATTAVKNSTADGYTLLFHTNAFYTTVSSMPDAGYAIDDFVTISPVGTTPYVLISPKAIPSSSLADLVQFLKAEGPKANYASLGRGTQQMILGERLREAAGIAWTEIPYKSGADVLAPLLTNEVQGFFATVNFASQQKEQPLLRSIAVTSDKRSRYLPDVPTFKELGFPQLVEEGFFMVLASAKTPKPVIEKLRKIAQESISSPAVAKRISMSMVEPFPGSVESFDAYARAAAERFNSNIKKFANSP